MTAALESFQQLKGRHKIIFLGDMFELGKKPQKKNIQDISDLAMEMKLTKCI